MGSFICLYTSHSITQEEWEPAYEVSLKMAKAFHLVEKIVEFTPNGSRCYTVPTREHRLGGSGEPGWWACGDSDSGLTCELAGLPRRFPSYHPDEPQVDILFSCIDDNLDSRGKPWDGFRKYGHMFWSTKTQSKPYHTCLLAIGCVLEEMLPGKVAVAGDVFWYQCDEAVSMVEKVLGRNVVFPVLFNPFTLCNRVAAMNLPNADRADVFCHLYQGPSAKFIDDLVRDNLRP